MYMASNYKYVWMATVRISNIDVWTNQWQNILILQATPRRFLCLHNREDTKGGGHLLQSERKPLDPDSPNAGAGGIESRTIGLVDRFKDTVTWPHWKFLQLWLLFWTSPEENDLWDEKSLMKSHLTLYKGREERRHNIILPHITWLWKTSYETWRRLGLGWNIDKN